MLLQARTPWSDWANKYLWTPSLAQLLKRYQFSRGIVSWTAFRDLEKAISSFCSQVPLCVWLRVCVSDRQCGSAMFVYHCSTMQLVRQVAFFLRLCFVPIHQCRPIFCHTECKYWTSFQSDVLYSLEKSHKGNHTLTAVWLFIQTAPFIQQEPGWGRPAWSVSRATLILLSAWATNDKATVWLKTSNVTVHTYLSFRSLAKGACNLE